MNLKYTEMLGIVVHENMKLGDYIAFENRRFSSLIAAGGRFARRNVCDSATEIPYWWRKICPESGQKRWLVDGVVTLF